MFKKSDSALHRILTKSSVPGCGRDVHLVCAPVPASHYGDAKKHAGPGQVPGGRVPQQVEGVLSWGVAAGGDVVALGLRGGEITGRSGAVFGQQSAVASYFSES